MTNLTTNVIHTSIQVFYAYINLLLYFPRLFIRLNIQWNPFILACRHVLRKFYGSPSLSLSQKNINQDHSSHPHPVIDSTSSQSVPLPMLRWLESNEHLGEHIALVSYPRSGNSLMRGLLEKMTGVYTGCDTRPDRSLSQRLQEYGLKGEGIVDERVWFVKTHYPERSGWKPFQAHKAILVVRNPWDAIDSYFNMMLTNSHNTSIAESQYERFQNYWDKFIRNEIDIWMKFHRYWTTKVELPLMVVRYEDLIVHREETLRRVFQFLTNKSSIIDTIWEERLKELMSTSGENDGPYKPRSGKIGGSFSHYSKDQFQYILQTARLPLNGFGYDPEKQNFPTNLPMPKRQMKNQHLINHEMCINPLKNAIQLRRLDDPFGRQFTYFRKNLLDPVISKDGKELNLAEVEAARQKHQEIERKKQE